MIKIYIGKSPSQHGARSFQAEMTVESFRLLQRLRQSGNFKDKDIKFMSIHDTPAAEELFDKMSRLSDENLRRVFSKIGNTPSMAQLVALRWEIDDLLCRQGVEV